MKKGYFLAFHRSHIRNLTNNTDSSSNRWIKTHQQQLKDKLTNFFLKCNQSCAAQHGVNYVWLHLKCLCLGSCGAGEDDLPLWYSSEHLKSNGTGLVDEWQTDCRQQRVVDLINVRQSAVSDGHFWPLPPSELPPLSGSLSAAPSPPAASSAASPARQKNFR